MPELDSEEMIEISLDAALGRPSRLQTPEAVEFRKKQDGFVKEVEAKGGEVHVPHEHPHLEQYRASLAKCRAALAEKDKAGEKKGGG